MKKKVILYRSNEKAIVQSQLNVRTLLAEIKPTRQKAKKKSKD